ncbi:hypothetical protein A2Z22_03135 [Candidatus Woesebacteria bacterium RBG_16_34_12]|uniref:Probable pectate lyase C n=1 Tax=Candidatus Woesebacteria bacterium RBG_16_34_12 TaxID=1802480 RepID=A0A1F7XAS4_9BACT|nr:MAG: hypothetical protein A2Z22_03135 [Candidatus Woesebacteria bacterium RBG_16_34_12]
MNEKIIKVLYITPFFLLVFFFPTSANAASYYVSTTGNDSNSGAQDQPWKTIQKAADTMVAGDTVNVQDGDYASERVSVTKSGSSGSPITYQAEGTVVMKGFKIIASYVTVKGFEIANTNYVRWHEDVSSGVYVRGAGIVVEENYIHDATLNGIHLYGPPTDPAVTHDCIVRNNRLYHNEMAGIRASGRNNLIENNEVWGSVQCHSAVMAVEDIAADNPNHTPCPYPGISGIAGLDADGIRFFGQGHIIRGNHIHDIPYGPLGLNPDVGDYNNTPHIDCFQTWGDQQYHEVGQNITFEKNFCDNLQSQAPEENGHGFMLQSGANNLTIKNNIIRAYGGVNTGPTGHANHLYIYNNLWINNLSFHSFWPFAVGLDNAPYSIVKNNIFYDQPYHTIFGVGDITDQDIDYNLAYNSDDSQPDCFRIDYVCQQLHAHDLWNVNPKFVNPAASDFHLQLSSPAINVGATLAEVINDYDGNSRPQGIGFDIGAYEYVFGVSPTSTPSSPPAGGPGDANNDGAVDGIDYVIWLNHYNTNTGNGSTDGDFNTDGTVDGIDYVIWLNHYGT